MLVCGRGGRRGEERKRGRGEEAKRGRRGGWMKLGNYGSWELRRNRGDTYVLCRLDYVRGTGWSTCSSGGVIVLRTSNQVCTEYCTRIQ